MAAILRSGIFGDYYGNTYDTSNALTQSQMETNAFYIYSYLKHEGWSENAISALLGNMQAESSINPGRWQSDRVGGDSSGHGYSLVQWTPYTKYTNWCSEKGYSDPSEMDNALSRILYEVENDIQWIGVGSYSGMSFEEFATSELSVSELATAFLLCYERPADQSESVQNYRGSLAENWYKYLTGKDPSQPGGGASHTKKNKYNFILFNRRRRGIYG